MRYRYDNRLEREHIGHRVVIRRWVDDTDRGMVPSDVLGILEAWTDDGVLHIRTKHGAVVEVEEQAILAAKPVPPPPRER
jgi:N-acetylglutamate synthase